MVNRGRGPLLWIILLPAHDVLLGHPLMDVFQTWSQWIYAWSPMSSRKGTAFKHYINLITTLANHLLMHAV